jgi:hypothetical protein
MASILLTLKTLPTNRNMKYLKLILLSSLMVAAISVTQAQVQVSLGLKGGANFASVDVNDAAATWKNKTGFHGGAFGLIKVTKFAVQPELIFSQQGSKVTYNGQDFNANFSYMNVPVLLKFYLAAGLNLQLGPQFGFLTSAESDYNPLTQTSGNTDIKDLYKNSDVSVGMGIGWDLPLGLTVDARYNLGVTEIQNNAALEAAKNQVFQLSLGYKLFKIGK